MENTLKSSIINISLRGISLISKFILLMYIAKFFSTQDLGVYGLFTVTVSCLSLLIGFELYTYNNREVLELPQTERLQFIKDQISFNVLCALLVLPFLPLLVKFSLVPLKYIVLFYVILFFENLSTQLYRFFIVLSETVIANIIIFIKMGLWSLLLLVFWLLSDVFPKNLTCLLIFWLVSIIFSVIYAVLKLKNLNLGKVDFKKTDIEKIKKGLKVSLPFFVSGILALIINYSGQYIINFYLDKADVGVYTFFFNIANSLNILLYTAIMINFFPKLIGANIENNKELFLSIVKKYSFLIFALSSLVCIGLCLFIKPILLVINKSQFNSEVTVFYLLMIANIIYNMAYIPHYILYAKKSDLILNVASVLGVIVNLVINLLFIPKFGIQVAGWSILISYSLICLIKSVFVLKKKYL